MVRTYRFFAIFGLVFTLASAHAEGTPIVVDSNGTIVGPIVSIADNIYPHDADGNAAVLMTLNNHTFGVIVSRRGFNGPPQPIVFESSDCSGTPYLGYDTETENEWANLLILPGFVAGKTETVFVPTRQSPVPVTAQSALTANSQCVASPGHFVMVKGQRVGSLHNAFVPPFSVQ
ncbi:MAG TPA: hypothetical protein VHE37_16320 [Nevskiaceae bacterium]|nr:hypothetical protein [Nevskiaceae bacterium]